MQLLVATLNRLYVCKFYLCNNNSAHARRGSLYGVHIHTSNVLVTFLAAILASRQQEVYSAFELGVNRTRSVNGKQNGCKDGF